MHVRTAVIFTLLAVGLFVSKLPVHATVNMSDLSKPGFDVLVQTEHNSKQSKAGEPFTAVLADTYCLKSSCVPKDTVLQGQLVEAKRSRIFHRPGVLTFQIQNVRFPDGSVVSFEKQNPKKPDFVVANPKSKKLHQYLIGEVPETALDYGAIHVLAELNEGWHLSSGLLSVTTFGASAAIGVASELIHSDDENRTIPARIGWGVLNSTGIPDAVLLFHKDPEVSIKPGQNIHISLRPNYAKQIYQHAELQSVNLPAPAVAQPTSILSEPFDKKGQTLSDKNIGHSI